ncbi:MAG: NADH-quinone oxidoreductase subunit J [Zoogloeaceae bacterium]|jgi:NADH-quinone oxidoreductase subunit J|nr:NADH-quinone oxidoreductase subunit J [Zoogloeaceae bacterium]
MEAKTLLFYLFSAVLLFAALRVITARNPVHAVLYLVLAFFNAAGLWLTLEAEFLALALVMVYVGAVMVLFLFVVMMLDIDITRLRQGFWANMPLAATLGLVMAAEMVWVLSTDFFASGVFFNESMPADYSNTKELGRLLFTDYVYPFELASIILLVAIIAAVVLTLRRRTDVRHLDPAKQIAVKHADRIRVVQMPAEKEAE